MRDDAWFDALFRAHSTAVHRYMVRRAAVDDAQDLAAEVLATAWRRRDDVPEGAELPWLYRTAAFVLANHRRKGRPVPVEHVPEEADDDADPARLAVTDDEVRRVLAVLSPRDRRILLLHAWEGLDGGELAAVLGISRGGADAALSRARARLREAWAAGGDGAGDEAAGGDPVRARAVEGPGGAGGHGPSGARSGLDATQAR